MKAFQILFFVLALLSASTMLLFGIPAVVNAFSSVRRNGLTREHIILLAMFVFTASVIILSLFYRQ